MQPLRVMQLLHLSLLGSAADHHRHQRLDHSCVAAYGCRRLGSRQDAVQLKTFLLAPHGC
jgi:hypothetical protein